MEPLALPYKWDCWIVMLLLKENNKLEFQIAELRNEVANMMQIIKMLKAYTFPTRYDWSLEDTIKIINNYQDTLFD